MRNQAAIYARVSTDDQAERGYSLPSQIEACGHFAEQKGFEVAAVYQDDISGAKPITTRPDGCELQKAIDSGQVRTVIVYCVDRLSRDIVDLLTTVRDWLRAGVEIYTLDVGQVTSELDIVLVIKGWQGSDERQKIRERTMRGRMTKARAGRVVGQGRAPYGYHYKNDAFVIDEPEAQTIRMIFDWYVNGDENGRSMSCRMIAKYLTELAIPRPGEKMSWKRTPGKSCTWENVAIQRIIRDETYAGVWRYGRRIGGKGNQKPRPVDEQIPVEVPAIVSRDIWEVAQAKRAYNIKFSPRKMKRDYLLRGMLFCGCGRGMVGTGRIDSRVYYCTRRYQANGGEVCAEPFVKGEIIETVTWDYIIGLIKDPVEFEARLRQAQTNEAATMQPKQKEFEHVIALLKDTEMEADAIAREIRKTKGIVHEKLEQQGEEVNKRYQALTVRKAELQEALAVELTESTIDNLLEFRDAVALGLENPTFEDRRRWLEVLQTKVTVTNGIAVVTCRLGREGVIFDLVTGKQYSTLLNQNQ